MAPKDMTDHEFAKRIREMYEDPTNDEALNSIQAQRFENKDLLQRLDDLTPRPENVETGAGTVGADGVGANAENDNPNLRDGEVSTQ